MIPGDMEPDTEELREALARVHERFSSGMTMSDLAEILALGPNGLTPEQISELAEEFDPSRSGLQIGIEEIVRSVEETRRKYNQHLLDASARRTKFSSGNNGVPDSSARNAQLGRSVNADKLESVQRRGVLIIEEESVNGHHFVLRLQEDGEVAIQVQLISPEALLYRQDSNNRTTLWNRSTDPAVNDIDVDLYVFRQIEGSPREKHLVGLCNRVQDRLEFRNTLTKGEYLLVPYTTGAWFQHNEFDENNEGSSQQLVSRSRHGKIELTQKYRQCLANIFAMMDTDKDGLLSQQEFAVYAKRAMGESAVNPSDWDLIRSNFETEDEKLTLDGFLTMHELEAKESKDDVDLWIMLESMGFNSDLVLDKALVFNLEIAARPSSISVELQDIQNCTRISEKSAVCLAVYTGEKEDLGKGIVVHDLLSPLRQTLVVENKSSTPQRIEFDVENMDNCISNRRFPFIVAVPPKKQIAAAHVVPIDKHQPWKADIRKNLLI